MSIFYMSPQEKAAGEYHCRHCNPWYDILFWAVVIVALVGLCWLGSYFRGIR
jgi:hypothetical protein